MRYIITFKPGTDPKMPETALCALHVAFHEVEGYRRLPDPTPEPQPKGPAWWLLIAFIGGPAVIIYASWIIAGRIW